LHKLWILYVVFFIFNPFRIKIKFSFIAIGANSFRVDLNVFKHTGIINGK